MHKKTIHYNGLFLNDCLLVPAIGSLPLDCEQAIFLLIFQTVKIYHLGNTMINTMIKKKFKKVTFISRTHKKQPKFIKTSNSLEL